MKSVCTTVAPYRCPLSHYGEYKQKNYHQMLQALDDKKGTIGMTYLQTAYNLHDAAKCNEHFRILGMLFASTSQLPMWELRRLPGPRHFVWQQMREIYKQRVQESGRVPKAPTEEDRLEPHPTVTFECKSFRPFFEEKRDEQNMHDYAYFSPSMQENTEQSEDGNGNLRWVCTKCAGSKMMTPNHYTSKAHVKKHQNGDIQYGGKVVARWEWNRSLQVPKWEDIYSDNWGSADRVPSTPTSPT